MKNKQHLQNKFTKEFSVWHHLSNATKVNCFVRETVKYTVQNGSLCVRKKFENNVNILPID